MNIHTNVQPGKTGVEIQEEIESAVENVERQAVSRGMQAVNALRNAELEVLRGQRSGRIYKKPHSRTYYTASAPGEPPARRTGNLRLHWSKRVVKERTAGGVVIHAEIRSAEAYSSILENGSPRTNLEPRPYVERIRKKALPKIQKIYSRTYRI